MTFKVPINEINRKINFNQLLEILYSKYKGGDFTEWLALEYGCRVNCRFQNIKKSIWWANYDYDDLVFDSKEDYFLFLLRTSK